MRATSLPVCYVLSHDETFPCLFWTTAGCHSQHWLFLGTAWLSSLLPSTHLGSALLQHLHLRTSCCLKGVFQVPSVPGETCTVRESPCSDGRLQGQRSHLPPGFGGPCGSGHESQEGGRCCPACTAVSGNSHAHRYENVGQSLGWEEN